MDAKWKIVERDTYRLVQESSTWLLARKESGKYRWELRGESRGKTNAAAPQAWYQQIGVADLNRAQQIASAWIDWTINYSWTPLKNTGSVQCNERAG
jgi:hypothetical protein